MVKQIEVIQEVISPELSNLNDQIMNKKRGDQIQFSPEKIPSKKENGPIIFSHPAISLYRLMDHVLESSILQFYKKYFCLSCVKKRH